MTKNFPELSYRFGTAEDGEILLPLHRRAILELAVDFYPRDTLESWAYGLSADGYGRMMQSGESFEIACLGEEAAGFCSAHNAEIMGLFVCPGRARLGIGSALLARAQARLKEQGHRKLHLTASLASEAFYRKNGWTSDYYHTWSTRGGLPMRVVQMSYRFA